MNNGIINIMHNFLFRIKNFIYKCFTCFEKRNKFIRYSIRKVGIIYLKKLFSICYTSSLTDLQLYEYNAFKTYLCS